MIKRLPRGKSGYFVKSPDRKIKFTFEAWCLPDARCIMRSFLPGYRGSLWLYIKLAQSSRKYLGELRISDADVMWIPVNSKLMYPVNVDGYTDDIAGVAITGSQSRYTQILLDRSRSTAIQMADMIRDVLNTYISTGCIDICDLAKLNT